MRRLLLLAAVLVPLGGCDGPVTDPCVENPAQCEPPGPEIHQLEARLGRPVRKRRPGPKPQERPNGEGR